MFTGRRYMEMDSFPHCPPFGLRCILITTSYVRTTVCSFTAFGTCHILHSIEWICRIGDRPGFPALCRCLPSTPHTFSTAKCGSTF
jgi:hypothetical protein